MTKGVYSGRDGYILGGSQIVVEKKIYSGREGWILGGSHIVVEKEYILGGKGTCWEGRIKLPNGGISGREG